ncbi:MATE family efflux transporter [Vibrio sonorensis]|uniref:MATE family efflux transporter n=1 Tax=Vibrio sonorensis TaxID=1004316 RepID=UPI0008D92C08|nr:MATE family efflux transporter [Vibrio sonorensis]
MKNILKLAFPLIISQLIAVALVLTDVWMMSRLSLEDLAAGGLGASVYSFVFIVTSSVVGCVANLIAIAYGQRVSRPEFGNQQIRLAVKGAVMLSVILTFVLTLFLQYTPEILIAAKQPQHVVDLAMTYVNTLQWAMLPTLLLLVLRGLTSTLGHANSIMFMSVLTVIVNIPISYLFAFPMGYGLSGLGAGTALSTLLVMIGYGYWVFSHSTYQPFAPWLNVDEYSMRLMKPLLAMGVPIAVAALLEHGLIYGGTLMAGTISVAALALHQILLQCLSFTWNINFGFCQASAIIVGKHYGANDYQSIRKVSLQSFTLVTILSAVIAAIFIAWPELISGFFQLDSSDTTTLAILYSALWVVALSFIVDAWQLLAINLLRGMKIVVGPTVITAIGYWLFGLPAAWWLMETHQLTGIWAGIGIGLGATGAMLLLQLVKILNQKNQLTLQNA